MGKYIVETYTLCEGWVNCWTDCTGDGEQFPLVFDTEQDAQSEIDSYIADCLEAVAAGDMQDAPDREALRIRQI